MPKPLDLLKENERALIDKIDKERRRIGGATRFGEKEWDTAKTSKILVQMQATSRRISMEFEKYKSSATKNIRNLPFQQGKELAADIRKREQEIHDVQQAIRTLNWVLNKREAVFKKDLTKEFPEQKPGVSGKLTNKLPDMEFEELIQGRAPANQPAHKETLSDSNREFLSGKLKDKAQQRREEEEFIRSVAAKSEKELERQSLHSVSAETEKTRRRDMEDVVRKLSPKIEENAIKDLLKMETSKYYEDAKKEGFGWKLARGKEGSAKDIERNVKLKDIELVKTRLQGMTDTPPGEKARMLYSALEKKLQTTGKFGSAFKTALEREMKEIKKVFPTVDKPQVRHEIERGFTETWKDVTKELEKRKNEAARDELAPKKDAGSKKAAAGHDKPKKLMFEIEKENIKRDKPFVPFIAPPDKDKSHTPSRKKRH